MEAPHPPPASDKAAWWGFFAALVIYGAWLAWQHLQRMAVPVEQKKFQERMEKRLDRIENDFGQRLARLEGIHEGRQGQ